MLRAWVIRGFFSLFSLELGTLGSSDWDLTHVADFCTSSLSLCFPGIDDTFRLLYSYDELALRNMPISSAFVWWVSHTFILMLPVTPLMEIISPWEIQNSSLVMKVTRVLLAKKTLCKSINVPVTKCPVGLTQQIWFTGEESPRDSCGIKGSTGKEQLSVNHWGSEW